MKLLSFLLSLLLVVGLRAQDCQAGWSYYRTIEIDNTAGPALTDYQVGISANTAALVAAGKLRADGADLRLTDSNCNLLPFWGDSLGTSENTVIWVKIPTIAAGATQMIRMYYGNANAVSAANGDATFLFFDDFSNGEVVPTKWTPVGEFVTLAVVDGVLQYASQATIPGPRFKFVRTTATFQEPVIFDFVAKINNSNGFGFSSADLDLERILFRQSGAFGFDTLNQVGFIADTISNGFQVDGMYPMIRFPRSEFQSASITAGINSSAQLEVTDFSNTSINSRSTASFTLTQTTMPAFHFILSAFSSNPIELANLRVRQLVENPPTTSLGVEVNNPLATSVTGLQAFETVKIYPNPAHGQFELQVDLTTATHVCLVNLLGQKMATTWVLLPATAQQTLSLEGLPAGTYFLQLRREKDGALIYNQPLVVID